MRLLLVGVNLGRTGGYGYSLANEYLRATLRHDADLAGHVEVRCVNYSVQDFEFCYGAAVDSFYGLLDDFSGRQPEVVGFSCYMWNVQLIKSFLPLLKRVLPDTVVILGGPEFDSLRQAENHLREAPEADFVVRGEGERTLPELVRRLLWGNPAVEDIRGLTYWAGGDLRSTADRPLVRDLNSIPSPYAGNPDFDFAPFRDPRSTLLLETYRGCVHKCAYCNWSDRALRSFALDRVKADIKTVIDEGVDNVYIIDSHFGMRPGIAKEIMRFIIAHNTGTEFDVYPYMNIDDDEYFELLKEARINAIGFGVQTTNPDALAVLNRPWKPEIFHRNLRRIRDLGIPFNNIDLVMGLPGDTYDGFETSVEFCLSLRPQFLHIHPLKVIPGSRFFNEMDRYGIRANPMPPYQVLGTDTFPFRDVVRAKALACAVTAFYHHFPNTLYRMAALTGKPVRQLLREFGTWACLETRSIPLSLSQSAARPIGTPESLYFDALDSFLSQSVSDPETRTYLREFLDYEFHTPHPRDPLPEPAVEIPLPRSPDDLARTAFTLADGVCVRRYHFDFSLEIPPVGTLPAMGEQYYIFTSSNFLNVSAEVHDFLNHLLHRHAAAPDLGLAAPHGNGTATTGGPALDTELQLGLIQELIRLGVIRPVPHPSSVAVSCSPGRPAATIMPHGGREDAVPIPLPVGVSSPGGGG